MIEKTVLLIEELVDSTHSVLRAFEKCNVTNEKVIAMPSKGAREALFSEEASSFSLVVINVDQEEDAICEIIQTFRGERRTVTTPLILICSRELKRLVPAAYEAGVNSCIIRPTSVHALEEAVLNLTMYWLLLNENVSSGA